MNESDLKDFQSDVLNHFNNLRANIGLYNFNQLDRKEFEKIIQNKMPDNVVTIPAKIFFRTLYEFFSFFGKRAKKKMNEPDLIRKSKLAAQIIFNERIEKMLCPKIRDEIKLNQFDEWVQVKLIAILTRLLTNSRIAKEFSIEKDAQLFSLMALNIWHKGIVNYCTKMDKARLSKEKKEFQSNTYRHYKNFVKTKENVSPYSQGNATLSKKVSAYLIKSISNKYLNTQLFKERKKKATQLIDDPALKSTIHSRLSKEISPRFFKEEVEVETVRIVTDILFKEKQNLRISDVETSVIMSIVIYELLKNEIRE